MEESRYIISDASKQIDVEQHTLRYWEEELSLDIPRNEMGHRYYREEDITTFKKIKALKEQGIQLKAIKKVLTDIDKIDTLNPASIINVKDDDEKEKTEGNLSMNQEDNIMVTGTHHDVGHVESTPDKMGQFRGIMKDIISDVLKENNVALSDTVSMNVTNSVIKEMDYLLRVKEEREEERFKQFDRLLREYQHSKVSSAASKDKKMFKKKKLFKADKSYA